MFEQERAELEAERKAFAPTMGDAAFYGPLGEAARLYGHTEADPAAILACLIVGFGNLAGNDVWADVADYQQHARLNVVIVGATAMARKSAAWKKARQVLKLVDPQFFEQERDVGGFGSGQKLVDTIKEKTITPIAIEGIPVMPQDPRVLLFEDEFVRTLKTVNNEGSIYSAIMRNAYDGSKLEARSRSGKDQVVPEGQYHLSVIGCTTCEELSATLTNTERFSGFGNRFMMVWARRSKSVALTKERVDQEALERIVRTLRSAVANVNGFGAVDFASEEDGKFWQDMYDDITEDVDSTSGQLSAMIARGDVNTLRAALIYALADGCTAINRKHLEAAGAVWQYCRETATHIFDQRPVIATTNSAQYDRAKAKVYNFICDKPGNAKSVIKDGAVSRSSRGYVYDILEELVNEGKIYERDGHYFIQER